MSEIDKHYAVDDEGESARGQSGPRSPSPRGGDEGVAAKAGEALSSARDAASGAAGRARERAADGYDRAQDWVHDNYEAASRSAVYARRRSVAEFNRGRRSVAAFVDENPIMVGVAGLAAGILIGALLPSTRRENKVLGPYADDLRREGVRYARDVAEQGREAISENLRAVAQPRDRDLG